MQLRGAGLAGTSLSSGHADVQTMLYLPREVQWLLFACVFRLFYLALCFVSVFYTAVA